jgi:hypothetical protein
LDAIRLAKFLTLPSMPLTPRCHHLDRLYAVATPENHAVRSDFIAIPWNRAVYSVITVVGPTTPDYHHHAWETCRPPDRHSHWVHTARLSPLPPGTTSSSRPSPPLGPRYPVITTARSTPPLPLPPAAVWQTLSLCKFYFVVFGCLPI